MAIRKNIVKCSPKMCMSKLACSCKPVQCDHRYWCVCAVLISYLTNWCVCSLSRDVVCTSVLVEWWDVVCSSGMVGCGAY